MEIAILKKIFKRKGGKKDKREKPSNFKREPNKLKNWKVLLSGFFVLMIGVSALSYYVFVSIVEQSNWEVSPSESSYRTIDREKLTEVIDVFDKKAIKFNNLLLDSPSVIDPSL